MKKKLLTILCVLALLLGAFGVAAAAVEAGTVAVIGETPYVSLQAAIDAVNQGTQVGLIQLKKAAEAVTVNGDVYVDLNGFDIASVDVKSGTFYGADSQTDDYVIDAQNHTGYGKILAEKGAVKGAPVEADFTDDSYLMVEETDIGTSFHCVNLRLTDMTLRPESVGLYFKSNFGGDALVAQQVAKFGVALSVKGEPTRENLKTDCQLSSFTGFEAGANDDATSTLLEGVMKETNAKLTNRSNAQMPVYGKAYVLLRNGDYIFGKAQVRSLQGQVQELSKDAAKVTDKVVDMYVTYKPIMKAWTGIEAVKAGYQAQEDKILKILIVGNSHGLDSGNLINTVFKAEAPKQKVVIGAIYYSGCQIERHARYAKLNTPAYIYYKQGDFKGANADGSWVQTKDVTLSYGIEDEPWDLVVMQQMNRESGVEESYIAEEYQYVIDYIKSHVETDPTFAWHMVWSNPDGAEYLGGAGADNELSYTEGWGEQHAELFPGANGEFDNLVMYNKITSLTKKYLTDTTEFLGKKYYDFVIPIATAVQYAKEIQGEPEAHLYRDYTHVNDYGRLMASYLFYAEIMKWYTGEPVQIDQINVNEIPAALHHARSYYPAKVGGKYVVTEEMKDNLIEAIQWALAHPYELPAAQ